MKKASPRLDELASASVDEGNGASFMDPTAEKRGRGRPKGKKNSPKEEIPGDRPPGAPGPMPLHEPNFQQLKQTVRPAVQAISHLGVKLAEDEKAAMGTDELEIIVDATASCINQYLPNVLGAHAALVLLSVTLGQWSLKVYLLRQAKLAELREKIRVQRANANGGRPEAVSPDAIL